MVFSQRNGKTIVSKAPKERTGELSDKQKAHKLKFQKAVLHAKAVLNDPVKRQLYEAKSDNSIGMSTYNVAVADLLNAPDIEEINLSGYTGNPGDIIKIMATDDFEVVSVIVKIENADGNLVEQGAAINNGAEWIYTAIASNPDLAGDKITVTASDTPANLTEEIKTL